MPKFKRRPEIVSASQWFKDGDHSAVTRGLVTPEGIVMSEYGIQLWKDACGVEDIFGIFPDYSYDGHSIPPKFQEVESGDWIITDSLGHHHVCPEHLFNLLYEQVG